MFLLLEVRLHVRLEYEQIEGDYIHFFFNNNIYYQVFTADCDYTLAVLKFHKL